MERYKYLESFSFKVSGGLEVKCSNNKLKYNGIVQNKDVNISKTYLTREFDKLMKNGKFLIIETLAQYKDFLNVDTKFGWKEIAKHFNKKWIYKPDKYSIKVKEFLGIIKVNFPEKYDYFEILFRFPVEEESLVIFYNGFIKKELGEVPGAFGPGISPKEIWEIDDSSWGNPGAGGPGVSHFKSWIGSFIVRKIEDEELLIKLTNWVIKDDGLAVLLSDIPNAGYGLFTSKKFERGDPICVYGGVLCNRQDVSSAYVLEITSEGPFYGWYFDARINFRIDEVGRYANTMDNNNTQYEINGNNAEVVATREILPYTEIYAKYGKNYEIPEGPKAPRESQPEPFFEEFPGPSAPEFPTEHTLEEFTNFIQKYPKYQEYGFAYDILKNWVIENNKKEKPRDGLDTDALAKTSFRSYPSISFSKWKTFWNKYDVRKLKKR